METTTIHIFRFGLAGLGLVLIILGLFWKKQIQKKRIVFKLERLGLYLDTDRQMFLVFLGVVMIGSAAYLWYNRLVENISISDNNKRYVEQFEARMREYHPKLYLRFKSQDRKQFEDVKQIKLSSKVHDNKGNDIRHIQPILDLKPEGLIVNFQSLQSENSIDIVLKYNGRKWVNKQTIPVPVLNANISMVEN